MSSSASLELSLLEWIELDNTHQSLLTHLNSIREQKFILSKKIFQLAKERNLDKPNLKLKIKNEEITLINKNIAQALTFKYLETCLEQIIKNKTQVLAILSHLKNKREIKTIQEIKRKYYTNESS